MALRTPAAYRASLLDNRVVYCEGERVTDVATHPIVRLGVETASIDYAMAEDPATRELAAVQREDGQWVSRYLVAPHCSANLLRRRELIEVASRIAFGFPPFAKEGGSDGLNAAALVSRQVDLATGSRYHERVEAFRRYLQDGDLSVAIAMTDVKGDRSRRPSEQPDPDCYVHIVDRRRDGIVIRGAKMHITTAPYTNELLVLPTRAMTGSDADWAVACAVPADAPGVTMICRQTAHLGRETRDYPVSTRSEILEAMVIFHDVFVPWERVFLAGEWQYAGPLAAMFSNYHRMTAAAYKYPYIELMVGTAHMMAEANGLNKLAHIREKISQLVIYAESLRALTVAACQNAVVDPATGIAYPDPTTGNAAKFFFADNYHHAVKLVQDICGGILVTQLSSRDAMHPDLQPLVEKYLCGGAGVPTQRRLQLLKLARDLVASDMSGFWEVTTIHAEGSLAAERLAVYSGADFRRYRQVAARAAGFEL